VSERLVHILHVLVIFNLTPVTGYALIIDFFFCTTLKPFQVDLDGTTFGLKTPLEMPQFGRF